MLEVKLKKTLPGFTLDIDLSVNAEILSILGPSGAGKTMTLLCIAGLITPDEGQIRLNRQILFDAEAKVNMPPRKRKIGFVFQHYALFPHLTVSENIAYGLRGQPGNAARKKVHELLELIHIPALKDRYPAQLSSGQQQRVALARAIAPEPEALLLDEPFSALDTYRKERLEYELLSLYHYYKGDILFVTHDLEQGFKVGTRIAVFDNGKIVQCNNKEKVIGEPASSTAARLAGFKNLIAGRVILCNANSAAVFIPEFGQALTVIVPASTNLTEGQPVIIGIRSEHLTTVSQPNSNTVQCRFDKQVSGVTTLHAYYHALTDHHKRYSLECRYQKADQDNLVERGESCHLYFDPQHLVMIPAS